MSSALSLDQRRAGLHISASALRTLHECPREWWFRYVEGAPREDVPASLVLGTAIHKALAFYYRCLRDGAAPVSADELVSIATVSIGREMDRDVPVLFRDGQDLHTITGIAARLLCAFVDHAYRPATVLAVEEPFSLSVVNPNTGEDLPFDEQIVGAIDLVAQNDEGTVIVVDHKTAARTDKNKARRPDLQMALYSIAAKEMFGVEQVELRYQNVIKTKVAKVEQQIVDRVEHAEVEAIEAVVSGLELINLAVAHPNGKRLMGRRRSWRCGNCSYRQRCREIRT